MGDIESSVSWFTGVEKKLNKESKMESKCDVAV